MAGDISFKEALGAFDMEGLLVERGSVRRVNKTHVMVTPCPCCGDPRKDKFYINSSDGDRRGRWNSYCCHESGDLSDLISKVENISRSEANYKIFKSYEGVDEQPIPLVSAPAEAPAVSSLVMPGMLGPVTPATPMIVNGRPGYLGDRGVSDYIIARHRLAATSTHPVVDGKFKMDYANRLYVPIFNHNGDGTLIGWQLRDLTGSASRKYLFPPEDKTSTTLYGLHEAVGCGTVMVVEGVFAKWAWDEVGRSMGSSLVENFCVASFGKKLSEDQIDLLIGMPHLKKIILAWDLDAAPQIVKIANKISGRKQLEIMEAHPAGDHDELTIQQRKEFLLTSQPYSYSLAAKMKSRAALMGA